MIFYSVGLWGCSLVCCLGFLLSHYSLPSPIMLSISKVKLNALNCCGCLLHRRLLERSYWQIAFFFSWDGSFAFLPPAKQKNKIALIVGNLTFPLLISGIAFTFLLAIKQDVNSEKLHQLQSQNIEQSCYFACSEIH